MNIQRLTFHTIQSEIPDLCALLKDTVAHGASVGFLLPLSEKEALSYWQDVAKAIDGPHRILLAAKEDIALAGTVQLDLASRPNGRHRAEVAKLMVHTSFRRRGIARSLMTAIEAEARSAGRTTLVLDTRAGDPSETLYAKLGYQRAGIIPEYARSTDGNLHATVFMYKLLN
ncbi:MAG TPA: GNAT family N-acetyltransferase [Anaerolineales bacterium]|nr:GNAT family N-acetyltransferase [Anaerolineales bacterium]HNN15052.1 GNAT family N-acetyltransferase [Anaerolineales bacterium]